MVKANDCSSKIPNDHETTVKYNIITSSQPSHMGKHNSLNSTNVAIKNGKFNFKSSFLYIPPLIVEHHPQGIIVATIYTLKHKETLNYVHMT